MLALCYISQGVAGKRSLDLDCLSQEERDTWVVLFDYLLFTKHTMKPFIDKMFQDFRIMPSLKPPRNIEQDHEIAELKMKAAQLQSSVGKSLVVTIVSHITIADDLVVIIVILVIAEQSG